ncbi:uncharacterized protein LOC142776457 isoform X2 [Rhipicephalus microplus]|uniref:uncharacterized protein LOC142776457 isoform X2 n=1 Tax=Rhipicephalus microplus TaxID=6941 RepID=UPI003F6CB9D0
MLNPFVFFAQIACCLPGPWLHSVTTLETTRSTATASTDAPKLRAHLTDGVLLSYHALPVLDSIVGFGSTSADSLRAHQSKNVTTDHPVTERHWHVTSSTAGIKVLTALCFTSGQGGSSSSTMLNPFVFFAQIACCLPGPWLHSVTTLETTRSTATASTDAPKLRAHLTDGVLLSYHALPVLDSIVGFGSTSADSLRAHQSKNVTTDHPVTERHWHVTSSTAGIKVLTALCFTSGQGGSSSSTMLNPFVFFAQIACCLPGPWLHSVTTLETTRSTATASTDAPKLRAHLTDGVLLSYHALPVLDSIVGFGSTSADSLRAHQSKNVTTDHPVTERHWHVTSSTAGIKVLTALCFTSGQGGSCSSTMLNPFVFFAQIVAPSGNKLLWHFCGHFL